MHALETHIFQNFVQSSDIYIQHTRLFTMLSDSNTRIHRHQQMSASVSQCQRVPPPSASAITFWGSTHMPPACPRTPLYASPELSSLKTQGTWFVL